MVEQEYEQKYGNQFSHDYEEEEDGGELDAEVEEWIAKGYTQEQAVNIVAHKQNKLQVIDIHHITSHHFASLHFTSS